MPCLVIHSVPSFLLPMEYSNNIQLRTRWFSCFRVWVKNTWLQLNSDGDFLLVVKKRGYFKI